MTRWLAVPVAAVATLAACVTINVYFPAAAAEKAADKIIEDVWGPTGAPAPAAAPPQSRLAPAQMFVAMLDFVIAPAQAQEPDIDVSSDEITRLTAQMNNRHAELKAFLDSGAVGLSADGYLATRDVALVGLAARNVLRTLLGNENADRAALYREIAKANGQPTWEAQIRSVFAQRWIVKAQAGWWYQDANGAWKRK